MEFVRKIVDSSVLDQVLTLCQSLIGVIPRSDITPEKACGGQSRFLSPPRRVTGTFLRLQGY